MEIIATCNESSVAPSSFEITTDHFRGSAIMAPTPSVTIDLVGTLTGLVLLLHLAMLAAQFGYDIPIMLRKFRLRKEQETVMVERDEEHGANLETSREDRI